MGARMRHGSIQGEMVFNDRTNEGSVEKYAPGLVLPPALQPFNRFHQFNMGSELRGGGIRGHGRAVHLLPGGTAGKRGLDCIPFSLDPGDDLLDQGQFIGPADANERFTLGHGDSRFEIDGMDDALFA